MAKSLYSPPYQITPEIVRRIAQIGEALGRLPAEHPSEIAPILRRGNRLRTIQASLAIVNNTLTLDQVTAIVDGRRVLGHPREIQEVKNAFRVYEMENFEFIHPFADGNGRMGRFWQTLILSRWRPILAWLPVETVIRNRQEAYYQVLGASDQAADASPFIEFMLAALLESLKETDQVSDQVKQLLRIFDRDPLAASELMQRLHLSHRPTFRKNYLQPAMEKGLLEMTIPDKPNSRLQKYRITRRGAELVKKIKP